MRHSIHIFALLLSLGVIATGCQTGAEDESESSAVDDETLTFKTADRGTLTITQTAEGETLVGIIEPAMSKEILQAYSHGDADLIDLYVDLTGNTDVPERLEAINAEFLKQRSAKTTAQTSPTVPTTEEIATVPLKDTPRLGVTASPGFGLERMDMTTQEFTSLYCDYWKWKYCWPNASGTSSVEGRMLGLFMSAYAYSGTITHRIQRHYLFKWRTKLEYTVPAGYLSSQSYNSAGIQDKIRAGVWDADGDGYHAAMDPL
jgi:hypothetical protein